MNNSGIVACCPQPSFEYHANGKPKGRCFGCDAPVKFAESEERNMTELEQVIKWLESLTRETGAIDGRAQHAITLLKATLPEPEWSDWIGWNGGNQPVADEAIVSVAFNSSGHREDGMAGDIEWRHDGFDDVVAYKVMFNTPKTITETWWRRKSKPDMLYADVAAETKINGVFEEVTVTYKEPRG